MKLTDYVTEFLQKKGIPAIMSRERLLQPAVMHRPRVPVHVHMQPAVRELRICFPAWRMRILIRCL